MEKFILDKEYEVIKLLGRGKGGYSYLVKSNNDFYTLKKIHHEPCDYYHFGNKIEAERHDYERLSKIEVKMPKLFLIDDEQEIIVKEYIEGKTINELIMEDQFKEEYYQQVLDLQAKCRENGLNLDWYPTNFIVKDDLLYYVDYECNNYMDEWSFEKWGYQYWQKTPEFIKAFMKMKK